MLINANSLEETQLIDMDLAPKAVKKLSNYWRNKMGKQKKEDGTETDRLAEGLAVLAEAINKDAEYTKRFEKGNAKFEAIDVRIDDVEDDVTTVEKKVIILAVIQTGLVALASGIITGLITYYFTTLGG